MPEQEAAISSLLTTHLGCYRVVRYLSKALAMRILRRCVRRCTTGECGLRSNSFRKLD